MRDGKFLHSLGNIVLRATRRPIYDFKVNTSVTALLVKGFDRNAYAPILNAVFLYLSNALIITTFISGYLNVNLLSRSRPLPSGKLISRKIRDGFSSSTAVNAAEAVFTDTVSGCDFLIILESSKQISGSSSTIRILALLVIQFYGWLSLHL